VNVRRGLALALAAAIWIVAIVLLWRTRVPSGLDVSGVDVHRYFNDAELRRSDRYGRVGLLLFLASQLTLVLVLAGYARWGVRLTRESAAGRIGTGMMLGMLGLAFVWLAEQPFTVLQLWWERRHGLLKVDYFSGIFGGWLAARLAGRAGMYQGIVVAIGFIAVGALFEFLKESSIIAASLATNSHHLVDLGPMDMGNVFSGDLLALFGGTVGGLLSGKR